MSKDTKNTDIETTETVDDAVKFAPATFTLKRDGKDHEFSVMVPTDANDMPIEASLAFEDEKYLAGTMALLPDAERKRLFALKATSRELYEIVVPAINEVMGLGKD